MSLLEFGSGRCGVLQTAWMMTVGILLMLIETYWTC